MDKCPITADINLLTSGTRLLLNIIARGAFYLKFYC